MGVDGNDIPLRARDELQRRDGGVKEGVVVGLWVALGEVTEFAAEKLRNETGAVLCEVV